MGLSGRLANATPFDAEIPYSRIAIKIPADSHIELMPHQIDDFRPGKPGSEEIRKLLDWVGCFLYDTDRSYDEQMLQAINSCIKDREERYRDFITHQRNARISLQQTNISDEDLEPVVQASGYSKIRKSIEILRKRKATLEATLKAHKSSNAPKYDTERTCFGIQPPREFATKLALKMFLDENPEIKKDHDKFMDQLTAAKPGRPKKVEEVDAA